MEKRKIQGLQINPAFESMKVNLLSKMIRDLPVEFHSEGQQ